MKLARYSEHNLKHFGLTSECYTHFTSPIRRYPDLMVHRLLKAELKQKIKNADTNDGESEAFLARAAEHCSKRERTAEEAEREFIEGLVHVRFMEDDYYRFIDNRYMLKGRRTKKEYHLGQKVTVVVKKVSIDKRQINFMLVE